MAMYIRGLKKEELKLKSKFNLTIDNRDTGFLAMERFKNRIIKWYPFKYYPNYKDPIRKYSKIEFIGTDYGKIPKTGFSTNLNSGYGFTTDQGVDQLFRYLEANIKSTMVGIMFTKNKTHLENQILFVNIEDFFLIRARTKLFVEATRQDKRFLHKELVNHILPDEISPPIQRLYSPGMLRSFLGRFLESSVRLSEDDSNAVMDKLDVDRQLIISTKRKIDKIYIEDVIKEFDKLFSQKTDSDNLEEKWHKFFKKHSWIFANVFAYPATYFKDKLNVGGHTITGGTDKIVDFLTKSKFTKNVSFIEIKTHLTTLVSKSPYRSPSIYSMSRSMTGSIVQVIDQKTNFLKSYNSVKGDSEIDSLNSNCMIVIGNTDQLDTKEKMDSFELFRLSNKDVTIVTYDEVKEKMEALLKIFTA